MFGTGTVIAKGSATTPAILGTLQSIEIDLDQSIQELRGQNKLPDAIGHSELKITGKAKVGKFDINMISSLLTGNTVNTGQTLLAIKEAGTVPSSPGPYTVTVSHSADFVDDWGVIDASTGNAMTPVASAPATGQYSFAAGVYTFASADAGKAVQISYSYTATTGHSMVLANQQMGNQPVFTIILSEGYTNFGTTSTFTLQLNRCVSSKTSFPFTNTNFAVQDFEFAAFADSSGNAGILSVSE